MDVAYQEGQTAYKVPAEWVSFSEDRFYLYPPPKPLYFPFDYSQKVVQVNITIPTSAPAGNYFCYLEGVTDNGGSVGAAVGSKLNFTVVQPVLTAIPAHSFTPLYKGKGIFANLFIWFQRFITRR